jgi:hypothetical protein
MLNFNALGGKLLGFLNSLDKIKPSLRIRTTLPKAEPPISHLHPPRAINPLLAITHLTYTALAPLSHTVGPNRSPNVEIAKCLSTSRFSCRGGLARSGGAKSAAKRTPVRRLHAFVHSQLAAASKRSCWSILGVDQVRWAKGVVVVLLCSCR